jgi:uncharacterized membrane protein YdbT with pleckstrin-like domain
MDEEKTIWQGSSSQVLYLHVYVLCLLAIGALIGAAVVCWSRGSRELSYGLLAATMIPFFIICVKWLQNKCRRYEITTERLRVSQGVFSKKTDEVELYRVKDYVLLEPFFLRLFGRGNVVLTTTDDANPTVALEAIPNANALRDEIRKHVEICRDRKRVRITELE